jgi:cytochrome b561
VDQLPEHDRSAEAELFARLEAEMGPVEISGRPERIRAATSVALVVLGLVAVVLGLSGSLVVSAVGYSTALFGLVSLADVLEPVALRLRARLAALHHARR